MTRHDSIRAVTGTTRLFGCIASPTDHVRAPMIFNRIFAERNIDAVMVPVDISAEQLSEGIKGLKKLGNFKGAAVTIPHKLNLAALCDELGPGARAAAAVNAVRFADDERLLGDNFDGHGFVAGHLQGLPLPVFQNTVHIRQADNRLLPFYRLNSAWIVPIVILISLKNHQENPDVSDN